MLPAPAPRHFSLHRFPHIIQRSLLLLIYLLLLASPLVAQSENDMPALEQGKLIERELAGDAAHSYSITLTANQFLHVVVEQKGIDVVVTLFAPDGRQLIEVDSPNGSSGPEPVSLVVEMAGSYRLKVRSLEAKAAPGRYQVRVEELRAAKPQDKSRIAAQQALAEGAQFAIEEGVGSRRKAINKYEEALPLLRDANDQAKEAETLTQIGSIYNRLGETQKALDYLNQALSLRRAVGDRSGEASTLASIGGVYHSMGEMPKALDFYNQALPLSRVAGNRSNEAYTLCDIGAVYDTLGERQKALDCYNQALPLMRAGGDRRGLATTLNNIGAVYGGLGEKQKALDFYDEALALWHTISDLSGEANTLNNIGVIYNSLGEYQKALDYYNQALPLMRVIGERRSEAQTLANIATAEGSRGNFSKARARIEEALTIFESLRAKVASQELRSTYFATVQRYYDFYIDILMRLHKQQPSAGHDGAALQASERRRARSLLETLAEAGADIRQGVDPTLVARERSLQQQLNAKAQTQMEMLNSPHTAAHAEAMAKQIEALTTQYQQIEAEIRQKSPNYAALTQPQPLSLKEIQTQVLGKDTLLLEYSLGEESSYLWAVTPTSITSFKLPKREEIETLARSVYASLTDPKRLETREKSLTRGAEAQEAAASLDIAKRLSQILLAPVAAQLGKKRLLIVADGALQYIPFGALPTPPVGLARKRSEAYHPLIIEHEIVSLPSASTLAVLRQQVKDRKPVAKTVAVLADPVFESNDVRINRTAAAPPYNQSRAERRELSPGLERSAGESGLRDAELKIPRLPGTREEARQILSLVAPGQRKEAFDFAANRQTAMSNELSQYRYLHFATHGFLNSLHPELSGIVLSMIDEKGVAQDGFLRAHEVFNLKLPAELVVLSACHTGLGKEVKGEGLVGLTRGFMYAGSPRVVVSLWSVSDVATAELMTRFYRGMLKDGMRPAAALRAAQVSLMKEKKWEAPFYWAAFTLQGEWR
ncbi:MAG: CHAT domain-containing protein [Pyrinomonadaceae bacterium]|nr:CHAT domain-containing protein [Pyrinomonadaceae bacterium]